MEFTEFKKLFQKSFASITDDVDALFEVEIDKDVFWNLYLDSFPEGTNNIYRERREYDCSCCRHFMKTIGSVVVIRDNKIQTLWDLSSYDETFQPVANALSEYIKSCKVSNVFFTKEKSVGTDKSFEDDDGNIVEWSHFYLDLPKRFVYTRRLSKGDVQGSYRDVRNVFKRSLDEITEDSVQTVLELIAQNSLYKGEEWKSALTEFLRLLKEYNKLSPEQKDLFAWDKSVSVGNVVGKIRNHSIGTLLVNISEGMELDTAVKKYEAIVAPSNYKRPKAIFTKQMLEDAKKTIEDLGYLDSLNRRYATLDDIAVNNVLFSNKDSARRMVGGDVFDDMAMDTVSKPKKFSKVEEVSIDDFVSNILPVTSELEVWLENNKSANFVSLIAPENKNAPSMFKWGNAFSWAYTGNIADSDIKSNVKSAGGNVKGVLRFSIQWNDEEYNPNDFDAHCFEPDGNEIFFGRKHNRLSGGFLDVDIIYPDWGNPAVENIAWENVGRMKSGTYKFFVHNYNHKGGRGGFKAEIEFNGEIFSFEYNKELRNKERVDVAEVTLDSFGNFTIKELLPSSVSSKEVWGLATNQFVPVSVVMYSPNYWDQQTGIGNRHYFFMLKGCINPEMPNGFYNEYLKEDLLKHKRVFEALGAKMAVKDVDDQLSGLGFSSTLRNELVVKVKNASERIIKIKF